MFRINRVNTINKVNKKLILFIVVIFFLITSTISIILTSSHAYAEVRIRCASTTSTQNSGLFEFILPVFENKTGIKVDVIAVGTGAAIEIGKRGDADVLIVHAKEQELKAVEQGFFLNRHDIMYNDFVIVGPSEETIKIKDFKAAVDVFKWISEGRYLFVSRGDKSGTHIKEKSIWKKANIDLFTKDRDWYLEAGQGMAKTLRITNEKRAYTITDRATWYSLQDELDMKIVFQGDPILFNQYGIMVVNNKKHKHVKYKDAMKLVDWIISKDGQSTISSFKDKYGNHLFYPNAGISVSKPIESKHNSIMSEPFTAIIESFKQAFHLIYNLNPVLLNIISISLKVSGFAILGATVLGVPIGSALALKKVPGKSLIIIIFNVLVGLPPVVVGLSLYLLLSRSGLLGFMNLLYTPTAMIIAQLMLALPIIIFLSHTAIVNVDSIIIKASQTLGAKQFQTIITVIKEARFGIVSGIIAAFGRVIAEVGAVLIVGGNIAGYTRVMTTTIALEADKGNFELAIALGIILLTISLLVNILLHIIQGKGSIKKSHELVF